MGAPISVDIRKRAVSAYHKGLGSLDDVAEMFGIGSASLKRWLRLEEETGSLKPREYRPGPVPQIDARGLDVLEELCDEQPDATLPELRDLFNRRLRKSLSTATIGRAVRERLNLPRKKRAIGLSSRTRHAFKR